MEDCSVGSIVWVRRRNGSWWPGRILGPEELSASHIMSPRSGTPVKLLGREDASVDYYNLEKSKRVKAFRCGEFDACIERAEASQGIPIKKREKYARREDAILHALELEQKQLGMKQKKPGNISVGMSSKTTGAPKKELSDLSPEVYMRNDDPGLYSKFVSHKYQIVPHEEDNVSKSLYTRKELSWEKDNPEAISRMEGLQDFGLQIAPSKRELFPSATWETSGKPVENHVDVLSCVGLMRKGAVHTVGCRNSLSSKRKRPEGSLVEETLFRKHDRHRPLVHAKSPISPSFQFDYDAGVISREDETNHMGSTCQAKRSRYIYLPANSNDSLDHSGYHSGEMTINDDLHHLASLAEEYTSSGLIEATESNSSERIFWEDEMEEEAKLLTDDILAPVPGSKDCDPPGFHIPDKFGYVNNAEIPLSSCISQSSAEVGVYNWCSKGKRNARSIARRPFDETGGKIYATVSDKHYGSAKGMTKMGRTEHSSLYHKKGFNHAFDGGDTNSGGTHLTGYGTHISFNDSDSDPSDGPHSARRVYWGESDSFFEPMLVDVDLKVQTKYQGEHVPLVSLMSRLNGKAIIGHPVQIEILEDGGGLVDSRASTSTPIWRTARRSAAQWVARSRPAMSALEAWDTELVKKSMPHARRSIQGKSHKKLASNLKIKTLSYTASDRKRRGRLIDPEMVVPLVACVPVKVVFSRILEAVRVRMSGPGLRGPS